MTGTSASTLQTTVGAVLGTPAFMPPEQCQGELVDHRADVYSLAVIAYQLFCGRLPFEARTVRELLEQQINSLPPAPHDLDKGISTGVSNAILKGLSKNPADRQSSTGMFAAQIRVGAQGEVGILNDGKFYSGAYSECFLPLVFACFSPLLILQVLTSLATGWLYREKLIPGPILLAFVNLFGFLQLMFLSQCYKAGCAMVLEDAASKGFFHPQVKAILAALMRQTGTLLRMFFSFSNWTSYSVFALWPSVWIAEKRVGRDAFERARQLGGVQPEATFALFARQLGIMLMASITSATLLVLMTGSAQEYATVLFSGGYFSIFFAIYPAMFTPMFLAFGAAFHFLYRSGRRCLGEEVSSNLPAGSRTKRPKTTSFVRPATLLWLMPPVLLVCAIAFRLLPQKASTISFIDAMNDGRRNFVLKNIDAGTPVDTADLRKRTPLMHAAIDGDVEGIRQLLARGAKIEARSSTGTTPLMLAISSRHHEAAKLLLDRGADPNATDNEKRTALMIAAMHGDPDSCKLLLARGAKSEIRNGAGKSAIDFAMEEGHPETASILRESR